MDSPRGQDSGVNSAGLDRPVFMKRPGAPRLAVRQEASFLSESNLSPECFSTLFDRSIAESFERESSQSSRGRRFRSVVRSCANEVVVRALGPFRSVQVNRPFYQRQLARACLEAASSRSSSIPARTSQLRTRLSGPCPTHTRASTRNNSSVTDRAIRRGRHDVEKSEHGPARLFCSLLPKHARNRMLLCLKEGYHEPETR